MRQTARQIILASGSATRATMLRDAGVEIAVQSSSVDEGAIKSALQLKGKSAEQVALALADAKAEQVAKSASQALVIGADQMLELPQAGATSRWFDKPETIHEATAQLSALSGRTHQLHSAVTVWQGGAMIWQAVDSVDMTMRALSDEFITEYLEQIGEAAFWSVGCYQLEGRGAQLFERVAGDFFTVLGLPLLPLLDFLRAQGALKT